MHKKLRDFKFSRLFSAHVHRALPVGFSNPSHFVRHFRGERMLFSNHSPNMEQLVEINFLAAIEGQNAERAMARIVSIH